MANQSPSIRFALVGIFALAALPALALTETTAALRQLAPASPNFLTPEVERALAAAPVDGAALEAIYRRTVRTEDDAASFFYSAVFLRLGLAAQHRVIDEALALEPVGFIARAEFLPISLRAEYRAKARQAAGELQLRRVLRLSPDDQLLMYLPPRDGASGQEGGEAFDRAGELRRLRQDPALARFAEVDPAWIAQSAGPFTSAEALIEAKVIVTRALAGRGLEPRADTVARVWGQLAEERARLAGLPLFAGRRVVVAAGKDGRGDGPTFGKDSTLAALRRQDPASLELLRSGERGVTAALAKAIAAGGDLTLVLETHGRPDALEFGGALSAEELAAMFAARPAGGTAIVIVNACFGHDFARAFGRRLARRGVAAPILIVPEEYGQATLIGRQENEFTRAELGLGGAGASTLAGLWAGQRRTTAVYAPFANQLVQLR